MRTLIASLLFLLASSATAFAQPRTVIVDTTNTPIPQATTTEGQHDTTLGTITAVKALLDMCRARGSAPSAVNADDDAVLGVCNLLGIKAMFPVANGWGGADTCYRAATASTNAVNCKAAAATLYDFEAINTTSTLYYVTLYNNAGTPTCGTGIIEVIPVPQNTGAGAGVVRTFPVGRAYSTGLAICITANADGTGNAAAGVYVSMGAK